MASLRIPGGCREAEALAPLCWRGAAHTRGQHAHRPPPAGTGTPASFPFEPRLQLTCLVLLLPRGFHPASRNLLLTLRTPSPLQVSP